MDYRIGHGYDVHRLVKRRKLILGGVTIPYKKGLLGNSDADVLLHSIMDAILGALDLKDIGYHFPDKGNQYKDADSIELCSYVAELMRQKGYKINNVDSTIIAQEPKLSGYIDDMKKNISEIFDTEIDNISIKATTEERLGFTGRKKGISAHTVCLLKKEI